MEAHVCIVPVDCGSLLSPQSIWLHWGEAKDQGWTAKALDVFFSSAPSVWHAHLFVAGWLGLRFGSGMQSRWCLP